MEEDLSRLEARVDALAGALERVEAQLRAVEQRIPPQSQESVAPAGEQSESEPDVGAPHSQTSRTVPLLSLVGQTCLVLCGAFLLRAMTDMAVLPTQLGLAVGLIYGIGWLVFADFLARTGKDLEATFFGTASVVIAYPLVWEAATTFGVVSGLGAAVALGIVTTIALGVAWRRRLPIFTWLTILLTIGTALALVVATHRMVPFAVVLLLLGIGTAWITYARGWVALQWLPALAVDLLISGVVHLASRAHDIPDSSYQDVSRPWGMTLALGLLLGYLASFAIQTLVSKRDVGVFEMVQTAAVLIVGLGGGVHISAASGIGSIALGAGALVLALAYYLGAFTLAERHWGYGKNHQFYAWLAFVLTLIGCYLVSSGLVLLLSWCVLSVAMAVLGARYERVTLYYQSAAYAVAAAILAAEVPGGLITLAVEVFTLPADQPWPRITIPGLVIVVSAVVSYIVLAVAKTDTTYSWKLRIPRFVVALLAALGSGAVLVVMVAHALGSHPPEGDAAVVAAVRSGVVATAAVALAALSRIPACLDLRWLVYPLFLFGGLKLALEDLPLGRPTTLFFTFAFYGIALILAPRIVRSAPQGGQATSKPQEDREV